MKYLQKATRRNIGKALMSLAAIGLSPMAALSQSLECSETSFPMICRGPLQIQSKVRDATCGSSESKKSAPCYLTELYMHFDRSSDGAFEAGTCRFLDRNILKTEPTVIEIAQPRKTDFFEGEVFSAADPFSFIKNGKLIQSCAESTSCQLQACVYSYSGKFAMNPSAVIVSYSE